MFQVVYMGELSSNIRHCCSTVERNRYVSRLLLSVTLIALSEVRRQRPPTICHSHYLCFATILYFLKISGATEKLNFFPMKSSRICYELYQEELTSNCSLDLLDSTMVFQLVPNCFNVDRFFKYLNSTGVAGGWSKFSSHIGMVCQRAFLGKF